LLAQEAGAVVERSPDDMREVANYVVALEYGIERLNSLPLSLRLLCELHAKLMDGVRGQHAAPGEFRRSQNWIGPSGCTPTTAKYVPPPPDQLMSCLDGLEKFLHDRTLPPLIQIALAHYQFEAIHPFLDGNGRVGRLLITLFLIERKILPTPLLYLSAFFEATRLNYYSSLFEVSKQGDWENWLQYFLNGVARQAEDALSRAKRINKLLTTWHSQTVGFSSSLPNQLIDHLAKNPFITINKMAESFGVAFTTMQRAVDKLQKMGIVSLEGDAKRNRVYCAKGILNILEEPANLVMTDSG
jgi:Fic family protein